MTAPVNRRDHLSEGVSVVIDRFCPRVSPHSFHIDIKDWYRLFPERKGFIPITYERGEVVFPPTLWIVPVFPILWVSNPLLMYNNISIPILTLNRVRFEGFLTRASVKRYPIPFFLEFLLLRRLCHFLHQ